MTDASTNLSGLSPPAQVLLDYLSRYCAKTGRQPPKDSLDRALRGTYPLFRYLFPSGQFINGLIEELEKAGGFEFAPSPDTEVTSRVRRATLDYIKWESKDILERIPMENVWEIVESAPNDENVKWFIERLQFQRQCNLYDAVGLSKQYSKALLEVTAGPASDKRKLIDSFAGFIGMEPIDQGWSKPPCDLPSGRYTTTKLVPDAEFRAAIALLNGEGDPEQQLAAAIQFAEELRSENIAFLLLGHNDKLTCKMEEVARQKHAVLLKEGDLKQITLSANPQESMRECTLPQLPPSSISPFRSRGHVTGDGFFGRRAELRLMDKAPNVVLLGARRIGKTSLLIAMRDMVNARREQDGTIAVFVEAGADRHLTWFQKNLMHEIIEEAGHAQVQIDWIEPGEAYFEELAIALTNSGRVFLFLIDEVDHLVMDPKIGLFEEFVRSMSNTSRARFVLSGYKRLRTRTGDRDSFLYNLFTPIVLGPLARPEAADLVRTQMRRIYVGLKTESVVEDILDYGTTFAAYVQRMCELLLRRLDEPDRKRCITSDDVLEVYRSAEFSREITSAVDENPERDLGPLERLILYWGAARDAEVFTIDDLLEDLGSRVQPLKFTEVTGALNYLTLTYLLTETEGKYRFYTSHLRRKLHESGEISSIVTYLIREFRDKQGRG